MSIALRAHREAARSADMAGRGDAATALISWMELDEYALSSCSSCRILVKRRAAATSGPDLARGCLPLAPQKPDFASPPCAVTWAVRRSGTRLNRRRLRPLGGNLMICLHYR